MHTEVVTKAVNLYLESIGVFDYQKGASEINKIE
jgi:hypothetical protein